MNKKYVSKTEKDEVVLEEIKITSTGSLEGTIDAHGDEVDEMPKPIDQSVAPEGTSVVSTDALNEMISRINRLEAAADPNRLDRVDFNSKKVLANTVTVGIWNGKLVLGWEKLKVNEAGKTPQGARYENLITTLILEDGTKEDVAYINWVQQREHILATIEGRRLFRDANGKEQEELEVVTDDGKRIKILTQFVNV